MSLAPDPVVLDVSPEGVAVVLVSRAAKRNAYDEHVLAGLAEAFETLKGADHVRIVFLRGKGADFSAGADIAMMRRQSERLREDNEADALALARLLKAWRDLPQFTCALVSGAAIGASLGFVAAADWAVACDDAKFRFPEVRLGLAPTAVAPYIIEALGARTARGLFASAHAFGAEEALRLGLINERVADEAGLEAAVKRLAGLAFESAPGAVAAAKAIVRDIVDDAARTRAPALPAHIVDEHLMKDLARRSAQARSSEEAREGLAAFLEKRAASWDS